MKTSRHATIFYVAILLVVGGVAYYGGKSNWWQPQGKNTQTATGNEASALASANLVQPPKVMTLEEVKAKFADLLTGNWPERLKTNTDKQNFIRGFLRSGQFEPKNVSDLIAMLHDAPASDDQQMMIFELLGRIAGNAPPGLGGANPKLVLQLLDNLSDPAQRRDMLGAALSRMAADDPQAALDAVTKYPPGDSPPSVYAAIFSSFAKQDPMAAATAAANLPPGPERDNALQGVAKAWLTMDPQAAMNWAMSLPPENASLLNSLVQSLAASNPKLAESYVGNMTDDASRSIAITTIGRKLATGPNADPAAALAWFSQTTTGGAYQTAVANLFNGLASPKVQNWTASDGTFGGSLSPYTQNTTLAISLLANVTDPATRQVAITNMADGWSKSDPQAALAWASSLSDADAASRASAQNSIMTNWLSSAPQAAAAYAQNSSDPAAFLNVAPQIANTMAQSDPNAALAWANSLPSGDAQNQAISNVLINLARSNLTAAWSDAANLPAGATQETVMTNLVGAEAQKDPAQAAGLIAQFPVGAAQLNATSTLSSTWIKLDPQAFAIWLNTQPPGDVRDAAIVQLATSSQATKNPAGVLSWVNTVSNSQTKTLLIQQLTPSNGVVGN